MTIFTITTVVSVVSFDKTLPVTTTVLVTELPNTTNTGITTSQSRGVQSSGPSDSRFTSSAPIPTTTGTEDPPQSKGTKSSGPIIGGTIGGTALAALIVIIIVVIIKRRRHRRRQFARLPTINSLLDNSDITNLAAQRDLSSTKGRPPRLEGSTSSGRQNLTTPEPTPPRGQTLREVESTMQHQIIEMIEMMSERIAAIEAHQRGIDDGIANPPPDYESRRASE